VGVILRASRDAVWGIGGERIAAWASERAMTDIPRGQEGDGRLAGTVSLDTCPRCGNQGDSDSYCSRCGSDLHVDLVLEGWTGDKRSRYTASKELSAKKPAGLSFSSLRQALSGEPGTVIGRRLTRSVARTAIAILSRHGGLVATRPVLPLPRKKLWVGMAAGAALLLIVLVVALKGGKTEEQPEQSQVEPPPAEEASGEPEKGEEPADIAEASASEEKPLAPMTTAQISMAVNDAIVTVTCEGKLGTAFFVERDRAVTNAHVACGKDEKVTVKFLDGRELMGEVTVWEPGPDLAVIDVLGASAKPIPVGDSTSLAVGDPVVLIGNPQGLASTVHEGKVSFLYRNLHGVPYLQVNGDVNSGNSGGPLLDVRGRVAGIISMRAGGARRIGFALPVEYLEPHLRSVMLTGDAGARWREIMDKVDREDASEVQASLSLYEKPTLISVSPVTSEKLLALVLQRWKTSPGTRHLVVDISTEGLVLCTTEGKVSDWNGVEDAIKKSRLRDPDSRHLRWIVERRIAQGLYLGTMVVEIDHCSKESTTKEAVMVVRGGGEPKEEVRFPTAELERCRKRRRLPGFHERGTGIRGVRRYRGPQ